MVDSRPHARRNTSLDHRACLAVLRFRWPYDASARMAARNYATRRRRWIGRTVGQGDLRPGSRRWGVASGVVRASVARSSVAVARGSATRLLSIVLARRWQRGTPAVLSARMDGRFYVELSSPWPTVALVLACNRSRKEGYRYSANAATKRTRAKNS